MEVEREREVSKKSILERKKEDIKKGIYQKLNGKYYSLFQILAISSSLPRTILLYPPFLNNDLEIQF